MARDDENYDEELPADPMAGLANAMIILTGLMLLGGTIFMWQATASIFNEGPMGG